RHLLFADYTHRPVLAWILAEHERVAREELKQSPHEVYDEVAQHLRDSAPITVARPNVLALARMLNSQEAVDELLGLVEEYLEGLLKDHTARDVILIYLREVLPHRINVRPTRSRSDRVTFVSHFDYAKWRQRDFGDPRELLLDTPRVFEARV